MPQLQILKLPLLRDLRPANQKIFQVRHAASVNDRSGDVKESVFRANSCFVGKPDMSVPVPRWTVTALSLTMPAISNDAGQSKSFFLRSFL